jgi:hypothetical protein
VAKAVPHVPEITCQRTVVALAAGLWLWGPWGSSTVIDVLARIGVAERGQAYTRAFHLHGGRHSALVDPEIDSVELDIRVGGIAITGVVSVHLLGCGYSRWEGMA